MSKARQHDINVYQRLDRKQRELISACGGIECAASLTRVAQAQMGRYHNRNAPDQQMSVDVAIDLEKDAGEPIVSHEMVRLLGFEVVKLPEGRWEGDINQQLAAMLKEMGDVVQKMGQALADDGCISKNEALQLCLREELADLLQVGVGMDVAIKQIEEGE